MQNVVHPLRHTLNVLDADAFMRAAGFDGDMAAFGKEAVEMIGQDRP